MPKIYSQIEKDNIRSTLRREAAKCLGIYGVKGTTVDELVRRAGIPKGTFYLFYENKESLFLDIIDNFSKEAEELYLEMLQELDENHIVTSLTNVFMAIIMKFYSDGIYRFLNEGELELVLRKTEKEKSKDYFAIRMDIFRNLFYYFSIDDKEDIAAFTDAFKSIVFILLHAESIPEIEKALRFIIRGLVLQMVE